MLVNLIAFSQTGTKNTTINDSIRLPKSVARAVAKDIVRKDSLTTEINILKKNMGLMETNLGLKDKVISTKDSIITLHQEKEKNYLLMLDYKDLQKQNLIDLTNKINKDLKKTKRELKTTRIVGIVVTLFLGYIIVR